MLFQMIGATLVGTVLIVFASWAMLWSARRWVHRFLVLGLGAIMATFFAQSIVRGIIFCNADPIYIPPEPGSGGEGRMIFNCDAPFGIIDRLHLYWVGPVIVMMITYLTWRYSRPLIGKA